MARKKKQRWRPGDIFFVPQRDGVCSVGQVLDVMMTNVASCAFYDIRTPCDTPVGSFDLDDDLAIAALSVTKEQLDFGAWRVVGWQPVSLPRHAWPNENTRAQSWVGSIVYDAAIAEDLLNAYNGLTAWDDWKDPRYLDNLLVNPGRKPKHLIYKKRAP
jgi:hypothetical protein